MRSLIFSSRSSPRGPSSRFDERRIPLGPTQSLLLHYLRRSLFFAGQARFPPSRGRDKDFEARRAYPLSLQLSRALIFSTTSAVPRRSHILADVVHRSASLRAINTTRSIHRTRGDDRSTSFPRSGIRAFSISASYLIASATPSNVTAYHISA